LVVTIDGFDPPIERELLVSPQVSLAELQFNILCPAIGWIPGRHAYAFRRTHRVSYDNLPPDRVMSMRDEQLLNRGMLEEPWIGPRGSTALDMFFLPFFISFLLVSLLFLVMKGSSYTVVVCTFPSLFR